MRLELQLEARGEGAREQGLAGPRRPLEQQVPLGDQGHHHQMDRLLLADDHAAHTLPEGLAQLTNLFDRHSSSHLSRAVAGSPAALRKPKMYSNSSTWLRAASASRAPGGEAVIADQEPGHLRRAGARKRASISSAMRGTWR